MTDILDLNDIAEEITTRTGNTEAEVREILTQFFNVLAQGIGENRPVRVHKFGTFSVKERPPRTYFLKQGRTHVPGHIDLHFNPHPDFLEDANRYKTTTELHFLPSQD